MTKRIIDIIISLIALVVCSPLLVVATVAIWLSSPGPVFFTQERIGRGGLPFRIIKFRTMRVNSENEGVPQLAEAGDERLTGVGRWLRAHHLDELPQIWNVLCGDMSLVGYRPERQYFIDKIMEHDSRYAQLFAIRPGVTSYATLYNGYTDTMEKMLRRLDMDLYYLQHHSLCLDLRIMCLTFYKVFAGRLF